MQPILLSAIKKCDAQMRDIPVTENCVADLDEFAVDAKNFTNEQLLELRACAREYDLTIEGAILHLAVSTAEMRRLGRRIGAEELGHAS